MFFDVHKTLPGRHESTWIDPARGEVTRDGLTQVGEKTNQGLAIMKVLPQSSTFSGTLSKRNDCSLHMAAQTLCKL